MAKSWKEIALTLGNRMVNHSFCDNHSQSRPDPGCPFCRDRTSYTEFLATCRAHGIEINDPFAKFDSVHIRDLEENRGE